MIVDEPVSNSREMMIEQLELAEELLSRKLGRQIDNFYSTPEARLDYAAHLEVFAAGKAFRERCCLGSNRAGKTTLGAYEVALHLCGEYPDWWTGYRFERATSIWACGESISSARDIVQERLCGGPSHFGQGMIPQDRILDVRRKQGIPDAIDVIRVKHVSDGISECQFKSYASGREDFQGRKISMVWLDEEPSASIYSECLLRTAATGPNEQPGRVLITATPLKGLSEIVSSFLVDGCLSESGDRFACQIGWHQVPHLSEQEKSELIRGMSKHEVEARTKGFPSLGEGAVYSYSEDSLVIKPINIPRYYFRAFGLDVGWNATCAVYIAICPDSGDVFVTDEYRAGQASPYEHAAAIRLKADTGYGSMSGAIDPAARGRSQLDGKRLIDEYRDQNLKIVPAVNAVHAGIYRIQSLIDSSQLKIFDRCNHLLSELRTYQWGPDGKPIKRNDHALDALRYAVMTETCHNRPRPAGHVARVKTSMHA